MGFFTQLTNQDFNGTLTLCVQPLKQEGMLLVSCRLTHPTVTDKALETIPPLLIRATAAELDEQFFTLITQPLQATASLLENVADYQRKLEDARKQTAMNRSQTSQPAKPKSDPKPLPPSPYEQWLQQIHTLLGQRRIHEALSKFPKDDKFPEQKESMYALKQKLLNHLMGTSLIPEEELKQYTAQSTDSASQLPQTGLLAFQSEADLQLDTNGLLDEA